MNGDGNILASFAQFNGRRSGQGEIKAEVADRASVHLQVVNGQLALGTAQREILLDAALVLGDFRQRREGARQVAIDVHHVGARQEALLAQKPPVKHPTKGQIQLQTHDTIVRLNVRNLTILII